MLTVLAIFRIRKTHPASSTTFRIPGYPLPPVLFVIVSAWMMVLVFTTNPLVLLYVAATLLPGAALYFWSAREKIIF